MGSGSKGGGPDRRRVAVLRTTIDLGGRTAPLIARINRRARRLIVRVDARAGAVLVTAPSRGALGEAIGFAGEKISWIRRELDRGAGRPFEIGAAFPLRGVPHLIVAAASPRAAIEVIGGPEPKLRAGGAPEHVNRRVIDWLKREARRDLQAAVARFSAELGRAPAALRIRDARTRWGSCSAEGALSFSWRLILAPPEILDYVAAHECAHLLHLDHSRKFWRTVAALGPDAAAARRWFEAHGPALQRWGATPAAPASSDLAVDDDGERRRRRI